MTLRRTLGRRWPVCRMERAERVSARECGECAEKRGARIVETGAGARCANGRNVSGIDEDVDQKRVSSRRVAKMTGREESSSKRQGETRPANRSDCIDYKVAKGVWSGVNRSSGFEPGIAARIEVGERSEVFQRVVISRERRGDGRDGISSQPSKTTLHSQQQQRGTPAHTSQACAGCRGRYRPEERSGQKGGGTPSLSSLFLMRSCELEGEQRPPVLGLNDRHTARWRRTQ